MEPVVFMPTMLASHVAKHCNHVVNSPDENNNIGSVYTLGFEYEDYISGVGTIRGLLAS